MFSWLNNLRIRTRILILAITTTVALLGLLASTLWALSLCRVGGASYKNIPDPRDLVADVLPPPAFLLEDYLTAHQLLTERDPARRTELLAQHERLKGEF